MSEPSQNGDLDVLLRGWGREQGAAAGAPPAVGPYLAVRTVPAHGWLPPARSWWPAAAAVAVAVVALAVTALVRLPGHAVAPAAAPAPVAVVTTADVRPYVSAARLTRSLLVDGGALRLDPPTAQGGVGELRALTLWRAGGTDVGGSYEVVSGVLVARADITLTIPVTTPDTLQPAQAATFRHRTGWVVFSDYRDSPVSCPAPPRVTAAPAPASLPIWLLSADGTNAVDYATAGTNGCGWQSPRPAALAAGVTTTIVAGQEDSSPTCSSVSNSTGGVSYAVTLLVPPPCTVGGTLGPSVGLSPGQRIGPLVTGRADPGGTALTYYDGAVRRLP